MTDLSEVPPRLRRDVGLLPLFMVSAGSVIGSGWSSSITRCTAG
jgi:hypothetical protein